MRYDNIFTINQLEEIVSTCNSWNGTLEEYAWYEFDEEVFKTFFFNNPMEAARACFFGQINNWLDCYIHFDVYGNLESCNEWEYKRMLEENVDEIIDTAINERECGIQFSPEINRILDSLEK